MEIHGSTIWIWKDGFRWKWTIRVEDIIPGISALAHGSTEWIVLTSKDKHRQKKWTSSCTYVDVWIFWKDIHSHSNINPLSYP